MTDDKRHEEELVELLSVQGEMDAQLLVGILESEGIEVMMKSHQTFSALPFTVDGMGAVKLMVRREDLHKAKVLLEEYKAAGDNPALLKMLDGWDPPEGPSN
ncbi:MAG: DUF2007 domain-containing protein [Candidatus Krumholzibacteria bacterium]|nr:DUF2007 domain-containing protein [Candidatus Krumholzibacteria bacterium]